MQIRSFALRSISAFALIFIGCSSSGSSAGPGASSGSPADSGSNGNVAGAVPGEANPTPAATDRVSVGGVIVGQVTDVTTALPKLPALDNVTAKIIGDSVSIDLSPFDGAKDYRVYMLPDDADITAQSDGHLTAKNATYRCAGNRPAPAPEVDVVSHASNAVYTLVTQNVNGYTRTQAEETLGYVYATPAADRIPVYVLGDSDPNGDNNCLWSRWQESRVKKYTTSDTERATLISQRWRDDGIAFYIPKTGGVPVYAASDASARYYYVDGPEAAVRTGGTTAFNVLAAAAPGTTPLMRVFYGAECGTSHDELVAGQSRFDRALNQMNQPLWSLHWSGITETSVLVIEAMDDLCPWPGQLAPAAEDAFTGAVSYAAWVTPDQARSSTTGELFINGEGDGTNPKPIARSFVRVAPTTPSGMDWFEGFTPNQSLAPVTDTACDATGGNSCWQQFHQVSTDFDFDFMFTETTRHSFAPVMGEFWAAFADVGADVGGKFRMMPKKQANMDANSFLYVNMETDSFTSDRRYPQIVITDQPAPIDWNFATGNSVVVETLNNNKGTSSWPNVMSVQLCNKRDWDVNNQCPAYPDFHQILDPTTGTPVNLAPNYEVGERTGIDRDTQWEVYASTKRLYFFLDGAPYGCVDFPDQGPPSGAVNVFFGNVLYHSGVDDMSLIDTFLSKHGQEETHRHYDNLAFKNGVAAPVWNEQILPCTVSSQLGAQ